MDDQDRDPGPDYVELPEDSSSVEDVTPRYSAREGRRRSRLSVPVKENPFNFSAKDQDTISDIEANREAFRIPERFVELGYTVQPLPRKTSSVAHLYGIKLVPTESSGLNPVWKCLFTNCFENDNAWLKLGKRNRAFTPSSRNSIKEDTSNEGESKTI